MFIRRLLPAVLPFSIFLAGALNAETSDRIAAQETEIINQSPEGPQFLPPGRNCWDYKDAGISEPEKIPLSEFPADVDCEVDLVNNRIGIRNTQAISAFSGPTEGQAVVKLVLDPKTTEMTRARIEVLYGEKMTGWTLNIGDSPSNNGYSGDSGHQSRDGEVQILEGNLGVYGDDFMEADPQTGKVLASAKALAVPGSTVIFEVSDNRLTWQNNLGLDGALKSPYIFSLNGQEDKEGKSNYDIYVGINRVVNGGRCGSGACRVRIKLRPAS